MLIVFVVFQFYQVEMIFILHKLGIVLVVTFICLIVSSSLRLPQCLQSCIVASLSLLLSCTVSCTAA